MHRHLRMLALPALLVVVFLLQLTFPSVHRQCALWSDHPRWWQYITCSFLSGGVVHLSFSVVGLIMIHSQFAPQVRGWTLFFAFAVLASLAVWLFHAWCMPPHAWLIGASGGSYALLGFFSWFLRKARFCVYRLRRLRFPVFPVVIVLLGCEGLIARCWVPQLAWQLHAIGFGLGVGSALVLQGAFIASGALAELGHDGGVLRELGSRMHEGFCRARRLVEISG